MNEIINDYLNTSLLNVASFETFKKIKFTQNYKNILPKDKSSSILDIGVGRGEMLQCLSQWGYINAAGVDISPSTIKHCLSQGLKCSLVPDVRVFLNESLQKYDAILLLDVLEHIEKKEIIPFVKSIYGALKTGGQLIVQVPNMQAPDAVMPRYNDFTHEVGFTENSLRQVLCVSGFKDNNFKGFEECMGLSPWTYCQKLLRSIYWFKIRCFRFLNTNQNPKILNPILFVIAKKTVFHDS